MEWAAYYELEPWGCEAEDQRWRQLYNLYWMPNFKGEPPEFLKRTEDIALPPPPEELDAKLEAFFGGLAAQSESAEEQPSE